MAGSDEIEIYHLERGQDPPTDEPWIMVVRGGSGPYVHTNFNTKIAAPLIQGPFTSLKAATDSAKQHAVERGLKLVYAKGF